MQWLDLASWFVAGIEAFAPCKDSLHPFCSHYVVFKAVIQLLIFVLFLVQEFERSSNKDLAISQLPLGDILSKD
jgi:hypothetical protein